MKRMSLLPLVGLLLLGGLASCEPAAPASRTFLDEGRLYEDGVTSHYDAISMEELKSKVVNKDSFLLLVYDDTSTCECWAVFRSTINNFLKERNVKLYSMTYKDIDSSNEFGIEVLSDTETIAIFDEGELKEQKYRVGTEDVWATDPEYFLTYMDERLDYSPMLEVSLNQLDDLYEGENEFTVYYGRSGCSDCSYVEDAFLRDYLKETETVDFYYVDIEGLRSDMEAYQAFKDTYGLSEKNNPEFGYGEGVVPTFFHVNPAGGLTPIEKVDDGAVYLNDTVDLVNGQYVVTDSYYTEKRLQNLVSLSDSEVAVKVLEGLIVEEEGILDLGEGHYKIKNSEAAFLHDPILEAFLDAYIAL